MAFNADRSARAALLLLLLCATAGELRAGEPPPVLTGASNDLARAGAELAQIRERQQALEARAAAIQLDERRLDAQVRELKQRPSALPESLQRLRLDRALRRLRDRLVELQAVRREQRQLDDSERARREQLGTLLRAEANRRLAEAEHAFTAGREEEANALYRQSLALMQESERAAHPSAPSMPAMAPDRYEFDPELTGREEAAELVQISVLLRHEAEELDQELTALRQRAQQLQSDLAFERRAARFQGIRDRETETSVEPQPAVTREAELERQLTELRNQISRDHARMRHFLERAKELETLAASRERQTERRGP